VIADVSRKGIAAALLMANLQAILRTLALAGQSPQQLASSIHTHLVRHSEPGRYVTAFIGLLHLRSQSLVYVNAGHEPPLLFQPGGPRLRLQSGGPPLGLIPQSTFEQRDVALSNGSTLVLYTDGITERTNRRGEFYGIERFADSLGKASVASASRLAQQLLLDCDQFADGNPAPDDLTLMVLRITSSTDASAAARDDRVLTTQT